MRDDSGKAEERDVFPHLSSFAVRFNDDIELMTGVRPGFYFNICWKYLAPATMLTILGASFFQIFTGGIRYEGWDRENVRTTIESRFSFASS